MACFLYLSFLWVVRVSPTPTRVPYLALAVNGIAWSFWDLVVKSRAPTRWVCFHPLQTSFLNTKDTQG